MTYDKLRRCRKNGTLYGPVHVSEPCADSTMCGQEIKAGKWWVMRDAAEVTCKKCVDVMKAGGPERLTMTRNVEGSMDPTYYVLEPTTGYTKFQHPSKEAAEIEAERLARQNPNSEFLVLVAIGRCRKNDVLWERLPFDDSDIPF
ncbi:MAG: hypothetical protein SVO01_02790 [Thermotogota bacterium]|nr:hypothetical protein [Thermotogota bacterium]